MDYAVRDATEADIPAILSLMRAAMPDAAAPHTEAFWRWKHVDGPFGPSPALLAVDAHDTPVGLRVFSRKTWFSGHDPISAVRAVDTATHPDWRRRGIFQALTLGLVDRAAEGGVSFVFNTPNDKSRPGYLKMGWQDVGQIPVRALPLRPGRAALKLAAARAGHAQAPVPEFEDDGSVAALLREPALDGLLANADDADARLHTVRDRAYLSWRYLSVPGYQYLARWRLDGGEGGVVIARRRERRGLDETTVAELISTPSARGRSLARKALIDLCSDSPSDLLLAACAPATAESAVLSESLFVPAPRSMGPWLTARAVGPAEPSPSPFAMSSWRAQIGDWEIF